MDESARPCPGCSERDRAIDDFKKCVAELEKRLDESARAGKRQSAPFPMGEPQEQPKRPNRKAGPKHGPHGHRPPPLADQIDEVRSAAA